MIAVWAAFAFSLTALPIPRIGWWLDCVRGLAIPLAASLIGGPFPAAAACVGAVAGACWPARPSGVDPVWVWIGAMLAVTPVEGAAGLVVVLVLRRVRPALALGGAAVTLAAVFLRHQPLPLLIGGAASAAFVAARYVQSRWELAPA